MKRLIAISVIVTGLLAGCNGQDGTNQRKARLQSDEIYQLKQQIAQLNAEIQKQNNLIQQCQQEKLDVEKKTDESVQFLMTNVLDDLQKQNKQLQEENVSLKTDLDKLKVAQPK
jgi:outer membrane murein-binding lipoprotein Lpp